MASSLSKSQHVSFHVILFVFLLVGSCTATRPGVMVMVDRKSTVNSEHMKTLPENQRFEALAYFHHPPPPTMSAALSPLPTSLPSHRYVVTVVPPKKKKIIIINHWFLIIYYYDPTSFNFVTGMDCR